MKKSFFSVFFAVAFFAFFSCQSMPSAGENFDFPDSDWQISVFKIGKTEQKIFQAILSINTSEKTNRDEFAEKFNRMENGGDSVFYFDAKKNAEDEKNDFFHATIFFAQCSQNSAEFVFQQSLKNAILRHSSASFEITSKKTLVFSGRLNDKNRSRFRIEFSPYKLRADKWLVEKYQSNYELIDVKKNLLETPSFAFSNVAYGNTGLNTFILPLNFGECRSLVFDTSSAFLSTSSEATRATTIMENDLWHCFEETRFFRILPSAMLFFDQYENLILVFRKKI